MARTNSQASTARYEAKAYDKTLIRLHKGDLEIIRAHAAGRGESLNGFIIRAIRETMHREAPAGTGTPAEDRQAPADDLPIQDTAGGTRTGDK